MKWIEWDHLKKVNSSYWRHLRYGLYFSFLSLLAGVVGVVHTFLPFLLPLAPVNILKHILVEFARETHDGNKT